MPQMISYLSQFQIPGAVEFKPGKGGLIEAVVTTPVSNARVYLHGAHVTHFQLHNQEPLLFMSDRSNFDPAKAIRGGIPICFPWFGAKADDAKAPAHGFARLKEWTVESTSIADDKTVRLVLLLASDSTTRQIWPQDFSARYTITVGKTLRLDLEVHNPTSAAFKFEEALHTYLAIADIHQTTVAGLEGAHYLDKLQANKEVDQGPHAITFTGETDRIYLNTHGIATAHDGSGKRIITVEKSGSNTTVVWNPWIAKAKAMADFGDDEWPRMLCIETCNVADYAVNLLPNQTHTMTAVIH